MADPTTPPTLPAPPDASTEGAPSPAVAETTATDTAPTLADAAVASPAAPVMPPVAPPARTLVAPEVALANPPPRPVARTAAQYAAAGWEPNAAAAMAQRDAKLVADYELQFGPEEVAPPAPPAAASVPAPETTPATGLITPAFAAKGDVVKMIDGAGIEAPTPFYVVSDPVVDSLRRLVHADLSATKDGPAMLHAVLLGHGQARFPTPADIAPLPDVAPAAPAAQAPAINAPGATALPQIAEIANESIGDRAKRTLAALSSGTTGQVAPNTPGAATPALPVAPGTAPAAVAGSTAPAVTVHGRVGPTPPAAQPIAPMVTVPGGVTAATYCPPDCQQPFPHVHGKCPPACRANHQHVTYDRPNPQAPAAS